MISRLPKWVWAGGAVLAGMAGIINAVGFLSFQHQGVTHLTGSTSALSIALASSSMDDAARFAGIIAAFVLGAVFSGFLIRDSALQLGRRYGVALIVESALLVAATTLLSRHLSGGAYLASAACGLQNAMASTYSGAVLRTTHVSGIFTDIGVMLGQKFGGLQADSRRLRLMSILAFSFFLGGIVGARMFDAFGYNTLLLPAAVTGLAGVGYGLMRHRFASPR